MINPSVSIIGGNEVYKVLLNRLIHDNLKIRFFPDDIIIVSELNYKKKTVLLVGKTGAKKSIEIDQKMRPTLSEALF